MAMNDDRIQRFPPVVFENSKVLILGSMPGAASLKAVQSYVHPRILPDHGRVFSASPFCLVGGERVARLDSAGVAPWTCFRLVSALVVWILELRVKWRMIFRPSSRSIRISGGRAEAAFRHHALPCSPNTQLVFTRLPSTSPAYAAMPFDEKNASLVRY
jgi:double-stranded uracil-DNA glycosylase